MTPRIGELFAGYSGLGMAVQAVYGGRLAWYSEFDAAPSKIMAHHHPGVPNHGDITAVGWSQVEPVDVLTGGFPCQDVSVAGRRAGMTEGTRSGLWSYMRTAIDQLRPGLVVIENVGGLFSAQANRFVEPCPYGLGDAGGGGHAVLLRAADAVLGDLASIGYDAEWVALRASDVGAPHGRLRVFITAHPSGGRGGGWAEGPEPARSDHAPIGPDQRSDRGRDHHRLMPTPTAERGGFNRSPSPGAAKRPTLDNIHQLLPTPMVGSTSPAAHGQISGDYRRRMDEALANFGHYAPAIHRWEQVLGRPAPDPTEPGKNRPRLSARFVEWLMGLPDGHVTAVPGLTRNQQLKALGNGVVPLQCEAALRHLQEVRDAYM